MLPEILMCHYGGPMLFMYNFTDVVPVKNYIMLNQSLIIGCCYKTLIAVSFVFIYFILLCLVVKCFSHPLESFITRLYSYNFYFMQYGMPALPNHETQKHLFLKTLLL